MANWITLSIYSTDVCRQPPAYTTIGRKLRLPRPLQKLQWLAAGTFIITLSRLGMGKVVN